MSDIKDWMPKRLELCNDALPQFAVDARKGFQLAFDQWYAKEMDILFRDAKVYYGKERYVSCGLMPYELDTRANNQATHEFLVISRTIEKPKPKTDREYLDEIFRAWDDREKIDGLSLTDVEAAIERARKS